MNTGTYLPPYPPHPTAVMAHFHPCANLLSHRRSIRAHGHPPCLLQCWQLTHRQSRSQRLLRVPCGCSQLELPNKLTRCRSWRAYHPRFIGTNLRDNRPAPGGGNPTWPHRTLVRGETNNTKWKQTRVGWTGHRVGEFSVRTKGGLWSIA